MKLSPGFWQGAAAASSLLLACGYVAYSAGALHLGKTITPPVEQPVLMPAESGTMFSSSKRGEMFPGSKSMILVAPEDQPVSDPPIVAPPSHFMGGSKSAMPFGPSSIIGPEQTAEGKQSPSIPLPTNSVDNSQAFMLGDKAPAVQPLVSPPPAPKPTGKALPYMGKQQKF